tara:strand:- start:11632 stop:14016 length:2385 start_codon:yes stop_codon:yes gene_type:complete
MAIDKAMYGMPEGIEALATEEAPIEIEIVNPEGVAIGIDGVEIDLMPEEEEKAEEFDSNLAEFMSESDLQKIAGDVIEMIESDLNSRKDWVDTYVKGLDVLGLRYDEVTEPWDGACGVFSTLLTEAAIRFQSESIMETFPAAGPVKTSIIGQWNPQIEESGKRVQADMNYQLTDKMPEYRSEHERALWGVALAGSSFKKVYYDPSLERQVSFYVPAEDVILPYGVTNIRRTDRLTHIMRKTKNDIKRLQVSGFYRDVDLGEPLATQTDIEKAKAQKEGIEQTKDERYQICEVHIEYDLPGYEEELPLPYVITIDKGTNKVLAIRRNYREDDPRKLARQHFVHYMYIPGFGAYGFGLIHIIGGYATAGTMLIRQLVDAGSLSNLPGGLKSRGLRIKGDDTPIAPGEWRDVDVPGGAIRDNILPLPYKEPSQVLLALLNQITEEARRLSGMADMKISDMSSQAPVGTTLALLERQLKTMGAVQARIHAAMKEEFKLLKEIIREYTSPDYSYVPQDGTPQVKAEDYDIVEVIPVSDPNASTMAQRVVQYQAALQLAQGAPQLYDLPRLHRQMLDVLGIPNADKLVPLPDDQKPKDPVSENMDALKGTPMKAFIYQDHQAHITTHMSFLQDPKIAQMIGQNPIGQQLQAAMMAHVAEHLGFQYRQEIEQRIGLPLPTPEQQLSEPEEYAMARYVAQAAQQVLQIHQSEAAQQQAQQIAQDPLVQLQAQDLQIKAAEQQRKAQKDAIDAQIAEKRLNVEQQRIAVDAQKEGIKLQNQNQQNQLKIQADLFKTRMKGSGR